LISLRLEGTLIAHEVGDFLKVLFLNSHELITDRKPVVEVEENSTRMVLLRTARVLNDLFFDLCHDVAEECCDVELAERSQHQRWHERELNLITSSLQFR
jgi:hypothetical protein